MSSATVARVLKHELHGMYKKRGDAFLVALTHGSGNGLPTSCFF